MSHINWIITFSSFFTIIPIFRAIDKVNHVGLLLSIALLVTSMFHHISETRHNLSGIMFIKHADYLFNVNRVVSIITICFALIRIYSNPTLLTTSLLFKAVIGLICLYAEENILTDAEYYLVLHSLVHWFAFSCLADVM